MDLGCTVPSTSLLLRSGVRGPTFCPYCSCAVRRLLCVAWLSRKPRSFLLRRRAADTHPTHTRWEGRPAWSAIHEGLRSTHNATSSGARAGSITDITVLALVPLLRRPPMLRSQSGPRTPTTLPPDRTAPVARTVDIVSDGMQLQAMPAAPQRVCGRCWTSWSSGCRTHLCGRGIYRQLVWKGGRGRSRRAALVRGGCFL